MRPRGGQRGHEEEREPAWERTGGSWLEGELVETLEAGKGADST